MLDAVVVGAGPAGIAAARALIARGLSVQVLEAAPYPGGRVLTRHLPGGIPFDLGAHWLHSPGLNPLTALAARYGVRHAAGPLQSQFYDSGFLNAPEAADCDAALERGYAALSGIPDTGAAEVAGAAAGHWRAAFEAAFVAKVGVPLAETSAADFAAYVWDGDDLPFVDGYGTLIAKLAEGLPVRCDTPVTEVDQTLPGRATVSGPWGRLEARHVVVTASTGVLNAGMIRFRPDLPTATQDAIAAMPMGVCNKVALAFARPVFGDMPPSVLMPAGPDAVAEEFTLREGGEMAVGMVHGNFGRELAAGGALRHWLLERLASLFGSEVRAAALPGEIVAHWDAEPWVRGYVACPLPGAAAARAALAEPVGGRLHFAGEAVSTRFMGDVHGAWLSGEAAALRV